MRGGGGGRLCLLLQCHARIIELPGHSELAKLALIQARKRAGAQCHQVGEAEAVRALLQLRPVVINALRMGKLAEQQVPIILIELFIYC